MAPSQSVYQRTPRQLPTPHPSILKLSDHLFVFVFNQYDPPRENIITAAEIAEAIKTDTLLRLGKVPERWPYVYSDIANHFNIHNTSDNRRFVEYDWGSSTTSHTDSPAPTFEDFGIRKDHVYGSRQGGLVNTPEQRRYVMSSIWTDAIELKKRQAAGGSDSTANGLPNKRPRVVPATTTPLPSAAGPSKSSEGSPSASVPTRAAGSSSKGAVPDGHMDMSSN
ncbi:hypothetical protein MD484_g7466, partial [Candolleomyces efflorescens]